MIVFMDSGVTVPYWNSSDKDAGVSLSAADRQANGSDTTPRGVRGVSGRTSGKWYFEIATTSGYDFGEAAGAYAGVCSAATSLNGQPIFTGIGGQYVCARGNSQYGSDAGYAGTYGGSGWASSNGVQVVGFAVDVPNRSVSMYDAGGLRFTLGYADTSGNPVFPWAQMTTLSGAGLVLRLVAGEFSYSIPSTYTQWG